MIDLDALEQYNGMLANLDRIGDAHSLLKDRGAPEEAHEALDEIIKEAQSDRCQVFELAVEFMAEKKIIAAKACANYLLIENPDNIDVQILMMEIYEDNAEYQEAKALCDRILAKDVAGSRREHVLQTKYWCCDALELLEEKQSISSELGEIKEREDIQSFWRHLRNYTGKETRV